MNHPNIVTVYEAGIYKGQCYYVMEFIEGKTLQDHLLERRTFPWKDALRMMRQACGALAYAWEQGIIHRDIKPANLMVTEDGRIKVTDFGIAKAQIETPSKLTFTDMALGSPHYMSLEQARDPKRVDLRTDVYALGATFYHLVAGCPPFEGTTFAEIIEKMATKPLTPIKSYNTKVPDRLANVIEKMLSKNKENRYQNGESLIMALSELEMDNPLFFDSLEGIIDSSKVAFHKGNYKQALFLVSFAHTLHRPTVDSLNTEASCLAELGQHEQAVESVDKALYLNFKYTAAWHNKGRSLRALGRVSEALECFVKAIESGGEPGQIWMSWKSRGNCLSDLGRYQEALFAYRNALQLNPTDAQTILSMEEVKHKIESEVF